MEFSTDNQSFAREPITESSLDQIRRSSGWIKFMAVLTILGSAIIALAGLFLAFAGNSNIFAQLAEKSPQFGSNYINNCRHLFLYGFINPPCRQGRRASYPQRFEP